MRGVIFGTTLERANKMFDHLVEDYKLVQINPVKIIKTKNGSQVYFENGDAWKTASNSSHCCGTRCNIAYIDRKFDELTIQEIIRPAITCKPFQGERYFDLWEEDEAQ